MGSVSTAAPHPEEHRVAMRLEGSATCLVVAHPSRRALRALLRVRWPLRRGPRSAGRFAVNRVDMDVGAVDEREGALLSDERQEHIGAAQHDRLGTALLAETATGREERAALLVGDAAAFRHPAIGGVDPLALPPFSR